MKSIFVFGLFIGNLILLSKAYAQQIPNGGFESWINTTYGEVPVGGNGMPWVTNDSFSKTLNAVTPNKAIKKVTDTYSGSYALCIQESFIYIPSNNYKDSGGGAIFLGQVNFTSFTPFGVAYNSRPISVSGYYKMTSTFSGADTARISATFKLSGSVIGQAEKLFSGNVGTYQAFSIPVNWISAQQPDKLELFMDCGGIDKVTNDTSSRFYLDDLVFDLPNGVQESLLPNEGVYIYPNPASNKITIGLASALSISGNYITLHNADGRQLQKLNALKQQTVSMNAYPSGIYFLQLRKSSGEVIYGTRISIVH